jgi:hypothetical protein
MTRIDILTTLLKIASRVGYDTVQSSPGSREVEPGPAGLDLKNPETGLD